MQLTGMPIPQLGLGSTMTEGGLHVLDKLDLVLTDPPYAIYGSSSGLSADITDDKIVRPFFGEVCHLAKRATKHYAHIYIFCDWRSWASWWEMAKRAAITAIARKLARDIVIRQSSNIDFG